jgi:hypothetical protein
MSAVFTIWTAACAGGTATIEGTYAGVTRSVVLTVASVPDSVAIQQASYQRGKRELLVDATSSAPGAVLDAFVTSSTAFIGRLTQISGGSYRGRFTWPNDPANVTIHSSGCGNASKAVTAK